MDTAAQQIREPQVTKGFTITTSPGMMKRIERFFALLHFNSSFGHSGCFGMYLDGDGNEKVGVSGIEKNLSSEVDLLAGVGYDLEIASDDTYYGKYFDKQKESKWKVCASATLYKENQPHKTIDKILKDRY